MLTQTPSNGIDAVRDWLAVILSGAAVLAVLYGYAKALVHLNGLGDRTKAIETEQAAHTARLNKIEREMERAGDDRQRMHDEIGQAKRASEQCNEGNIEMKADIVGAINEMRMVVTNEMGALRERVKALEVEMHLRNKRDHPL